MRVVFHASTDRPGVLGNVHNLLDDDTVDVSAVALVGHADGLDLLLSAGRHADRVRELVESGVDVAACRNTMANRDRTERDLVDGVRVVASGVGELARLQHEGYAYLRP